MLVSKNIRLVTMNPLSDHEVARLKLLAELDQRKTQSERNRWGQFATPTALATEVVAFALACLPHQAKISYLEPGFGTGAFFSALREAVSAQRLRRTAGFELDPHYGNAAKKLWRGTGLKLALTDFTSASPPKSERAKFNLVVSNPPYARHHHLSKEFKQQLRSQVSERLGLELSGLSGLYAYFMVLSQSWMSPSGIGAWLVPSEFMDVNYGKQVKRFLTDAVTLVRVHRYDPTDAQFDDALVSSAVVVFRNEIPDPAHRVTFTFGGTLAAPRKSASVSLPELRQLRKWTALPHHANKMLADEHDVCRLADLFLIKRGLATGCNDFFIMTPEQAKQRSIPDEFLRPILPSPRYLPDDVIERDANGFPLVPHQRVLLNCNLRFDELSAKFPALRDYLLQGIERGVADRYLCRHRDPWYSQEHRPAAPILCTYLGRPSVQRASPFRFILNYSEATAANVYLLLYPKPSLASIITDVPGGMRAIWQALSRIPADVLLGEGRVYGGGLYKLEPKELANVPAEFILDAVDQLKPHRHD